MRTLTRKNRPTGFSLIELIVGMMLVSMLLAALYACAQMIQSSQLVTNARVEPRQQLRTAEIRFAVYATGATKFYTGLQSAEEDPEPLTINGYVCNLPYYEPPDGGTPGRWHNGDTIAIAVPEDFSRPTDDEVNPIPERPDQVVPLYPLTSAKAVPDGFPDGTHTIVVLTAQLRPVQGRDQGARSLVLMRWERVSGGSLTPREPESINLEALGNPTNVTIFDTFLKPGEEGFYVRYLINDRDVPYSSEVVASFEHTADALRTVAQEETFHYTFSTRNL